MKIYSLIVLNFDGGRGDYVFILISGKIFYLFYQTS